MPRPLNEIANKSNLPEADYLVRFETIEATTSKKDQPMIKFKATVLEGPQKGQDCTWWRSCAENAIWKLGGDVINLMESDTVEMPDPTYLNPEGPRDTMAQLEAWLNKHFYNTTAVVHTSKRVENGKTYSDVEVVGRIRNNGAAPTPSAGAAPPVPSSGFSNI